MLATETQQRIEERIANQLVAYEQKISTLVKAAEESLVNRSGKIDADLAANVQTLNHYVEHRLLTAQQNIDAIVNRSADHLNVIEGRANQISQSVNVYTEEAIARVRAECESTLAPIQRRLIAHVDEMETRLSSDMANIEDTMKGQMNGFYLHLDQTAETFQKQLDELAADFRKRAETTVTAARQQVRQQVDSIEEEVRLSARPILHNIDDRRRSAESQTAAMLSGLEEAMKIRLQELRRGGESMIQLAETQLVDKLKLIRPQAQAAVEAAQKQIGQQLHTALESARATVELSEQQLAERIEDLRPRAAHAAQTARAEITQQIASLESETTTATGWLEQRLTQRIDELTYRARKTINDQIRELDDASERMRRRDNSQHTIDPSGKPLEVDVHVQNPSQQRTSAA